MNPVKFFFEKPETYLHKNYGIQVRAYLVKNIVPKQSRTILDVGCGNGGVSWQFLETHHITFLDFSNNMIELVRSRLQAKGISNNSLVSTSVLDFRPTEKFEVILAIGVLAHLPSVEEFIRHTTEFLIKPGGTLVLQFSESTNPLTKFYLRRNYNSTYMLTPINKDILLMQLKLRGFIVKQTIRYGLVFPGMGFLPDRFLFFYSLLIIKSGLGRLFGSEFILKLEWNG
ncbi:MAG: class I SAM-dependent methyltransferase [Cyclobacteriaceae bacterium]|nr:class I SAM-dependent methyltransferase [Cyclobacteriaceae bacterium]